MEIIKLENGSSDHNPVVAVVNNNFTSSKYTKTVTKSSMKNFTSESWNNALLKKEWTKVENCEDLNGKVEIFTQFIEEALNEVAPVR